MRPEWERLFVEMQAALQDCYALPPDDPLKMIECCFIKSDQYWARVRNQVGQYSFPSPEEEIHFFKHLKPAFTSEVEYYNLLYHVEIFKPVSTEDLRAFWLREQQRLADFIRDHLEFYKYYKDGDTHNDEQYFIRANSHPLRPSDTKIYDRDTNVLTDYDHLITSILALEKFDGYVKGKLKDLPG